MSTADLPAPPERLHALDNLRGLVMWLGIVIHVSAIHAVNDSPLPWRDTQRTVVADLLLFLIHSFRMPVFFILAGFFAALLMQQRGAPGMLKNRVLRVGLPFAVFWPLIFIASVTLALAFLNLMTRGTWGLDETVLQRYAGVPRGPTTLHMWFLWMLLWLCVLTAALHRYGGRPVMRAACGVAAVASRIGAAWWGFAALALPLAAVGALYPKGIVIVSGSFAPPPAEWAHHGLFFAFGLCLHANRATLLGLFERRAWRYAAAGCAFFLLSLVLVGRQSQAPAALALFPFWIALAYNCATWLWSFALIGLFLRYLPAHNRALRYLSDSSYWVYLLHFPVTIGFGAVLYSLGWPAVAKMGLNIAATTALCLVTYQLFVRYTAISQLLNGRRHVRKGRAALAPAG